MYSAEMMLLAVPIIYRTLSKDASLHPLEKHDRKIVGIRRLVLLVKNCSIFIYYMNYPAFPY